MTINKAVQKLNVAIRSYQSAQKTEKQAEKTLSSAVAGEKKALAAIKAQEQAIIAGYGTLTDPAAQQAALQKEFALGQKYAATQSKFDAAIKHDKAVITKDKKAVTAKHKAALKALTPAEYHLGLKETNRDRKALGLKSVKHVIRPKGSDRQQKAANGVTLGKKYLGRYESDLQRHGITSKCPYNESCANFVTSMLYRSKAINFKTLGVADLNNRLRAAGWKVVPRSQAKPGDVWICNGAHGESHTELVASNKGGKVTLLGSNNHPRPGDQQINYDTYSANISGSFILSPP